MTVKHLIALVTLGLLYLMNRHEKLLRTILDGESDANIRVADVRALMLHEGLKKGFEGITISTVSRVLLRD